MNGKAIFIGCGLDNSVKIIDYKSGQVTNLFTHNGPVINIYSIEERNIDSFISISTDQTL